MQMNVVVTMVTSHILKYLRSAKRNFLNRLEICRKIIL